MDILFEDNVPVASIAYDALVAQQQIIIETASLLYTYQKTGDVEIVEEGFMDILNNIADAVIAMIAKIRDTVRNFIMRLNSRRASYQKVMQKSQELLTREIYPFDICGYDFNVSDNKTRPVIGVVHDLYLAYNVRMMDFNKLTSDQVREICEKVTNEHELSLKRSNLLGVDGEALTQDELNRRAFIYYRSGQEESHDMNITKDVIKKIMEEYQGVLTEHKYTIDEQKTLNTLLNDMERDFKVNIPNKVKKDPRLKNAFMHIPTGVSDADKFNGMIANQDQKIANINDFNAYVNAKYKQTVAIAAAVTTVYTARIAAIESKMRQDEHIIREAMNHIGESIDESMAIYDKYNSYPCTPNQNWLCVTEGCELTGGVL